MVINIQYLLYVDRLMPRFPCLFRGKYLLENAGNGISECLGFKIFWGNMPPDPGGEGTPIHYLYGYVPPNRVVILKLLI